MDKRGSGDVVGVTDRWWDKKLPANHCGRLELKKIARECLFKVNICGICCGVFLEEMNVGSFNFKFRHALDWMSYRFPEWMEKLAVVCSS